MTATLAPITIPGLERAPHFGSIIGKKDNLLALDCQACNFIHLSPIPQSGIYANGVYHSQIKPTMSSDIETDLSWWTIVYKDWLETIKDIFAIFSMDKPLRILDIGAGTGDFVRLAAKDPEVSGVVGIEADPHMARKNNLFCGSYENYSGNLPVSVITAHWVLEHLADPRHFIQWAYENLFASGILCLTIPNDFTALQRKASEHLNRPFYWLDPTHINYFNFDSLKKLLEANDFRVMNSMTYGSWQPEFHLLNNENYLDNSSFRPFLASNSHGWRIVNVGQQSLAPNAGYGNAGLGARPDHLRF